MNTSKIIVCDLDGTLAPSKSDLEASMAETIGQILTKHRLAVVSGGSYAQFQKQFISHVSHSGPELSNLYIFPTNGSACFIYDLEQKKWRALYEEVMDKTDRDLIISAFQKAIIESGIDVSNPYGQVIEDRGGQVTFSGRGQEAPLDVKKAWDPDKSKRKEIVAILEREIPQFEIRIGGATSIDVTHKGITKAYAIRKIEEILHAQKEDIVFIGDALFPGGNDFAATETGVQCIPTSGPQETEVILRSL